MMATLNDLLTSRIPPNSQEAERAVLGSVLLDKNALAITVDVLVGTDFYRESHRKIYASAMALFERGDPIDIITLVEELRRDKALDEIGGLPYLAGLEEEAAILSNVAAYAAVIREKSLLREVIRASTSSIGYAYEGQRPVRELLEEAEQAFFKIADRQIQGTTRSARSLLKDTFEYIEVLADRKIEVTGLSSGIEALDLITSGFQRSDLIIVAGRPSSGKTAFALGVGRSAALDGKRVLVLSLEMAARQLMMRLLAAEARVDGARLRTGYLAPTDWTRLTSAAGRLSEGALAIDDSATLTPLELRAKARRFAADGGIDLLIVDYLQLMTTGRRGENRQQEVTVISRSLKAVAKELNCPVLALSQLSRSVESREKKEPVISDLRESGAIEQDADVVLMLYRPRMYGLEVDGDSDSEIIVGKQRNGPTGRVPVVFISEYASFESMTRRAFS